MKETINSIQTKLDHLYNQTQVKQFLHTYSSNVKGSLLKNFTWIFDLLRSMTGLFSTLTTTW